MENFIYGGVLVFTNLAKFILEMLTLLLQSKKLLGSRTSPARIYLEKLILKQCS